MDNFKPIKRRKKIRFLGDIKNQTIIDQYEKIGWLDGIENETDKYILAKLYEDLTKIIVKFQAMQEYPTFLLFPLAKQLYLKHKVTIDPTFMLKYLRNYDEIKEANNFDDKQMMEHLFKIAEATIEKRIVNK